MERLTSAVIVRASWISGVFLLAFIGGALGEGTYQRTKDGKTIVWNNDPKPGEAATWFGDRDAEGYATKVGTLTWYTANGTVYARYFGNMVHGKFNGMVNSHSRGKTDHAIFADGQRTTRWVAGRAPSLRVAQQPPRLVKPTAKLAKANLNVRHQTSQVSLENVPPPQHAGEQAVQPPSAGDRSIEGTAAKELSRQQANPSIPAASPSPISPESLQGVEPEAPAEGPASVTDERRGKLASIASEKTQSPNSQPVMPEADLASGNPSSGEQSPMTNSDTGRQISDVSSKQSPEQAAPKPQPATTPGWPQNDIDSSLQSLSQPPSSLHSVARTATSPEASPSLTKEEVIMIANAKARTRGYNRADFHRAEPQFNPAYKVWSVSYQESAVNGKDQAGKHFIVIVDDKTKGAVFELRR